MTLAEYYRKTLGKSPSQIFAILRKKEKVKAGPLLIDVILIKPNDELGTVGQVIQVKPTKMQTELYPSRRAVYATKENIEKWAIRPYRVGKMIQELGIDEEEAWKRVDEEIEKRRELLNKQRSIIHYPKWFTDKHPEYSS